MRSNKQPTRWIWYLEGRPEKVSAKRPCKPEPATKRLSFRGLSPYPIGRIQLSKDLGGVWLILEAAHPGCRDWRRIVLQRATAPRPGEIRRRRYRIRWSILLRRCSENSDGRALRTQNPTLAERLATFLTFHFGPEVESVRIIEERIRRERIQRQFEECWGE